MDKLKDPAMILSVIANIGVVGTSAYFYKQVEAIRGDLTKINQTLNGLLLKVNQYEKGSQNHSEAILTLGEKVKHFNTLIEDLSNPELVQDLDTDIEEIIAVLGENKIVVERPSQQRRYRSGDRRSTTRSRVEEYEDRRNSHSRSNGNRSIERFDRSRNEDMRTPNRRDTYRKPQVRSDPMGRAEARADYDMMGEDEDDDDLINQVRLQARN